MFGVLIPHGFVPLALNRILSCHVQPIFSVVFHWPFAKFFVHFREPKEDLVDVHVFQGLVFDVAIDVSAR